ncbi:MAG: transposase, partial [Candidatus Liptonbacteria bacterium]
AQWSSKDTLKTKAWVGHKAQVAETVQDEPRQNGEPTKSVITAIVTQNATESDKAGMTKVFKEQEQLGLAKPETLYADGGYVAGPSMAKAIAEGRELMGPAPASPDRGVYTADAFQVNVEQRHAVCPTGKTSTQCARLMEGKTGAITYRFEWCGLCQSCAVKEACLHKGERDRMLRVNEHHTLTQARRKLMRTEEFKKDMHHRNGIEGTQSELVRGYGLRQARYRGSKKTRLQNYFIGAACNIKRWCRRVTWEAQQAADRSLRVEQPVAVSA